MLSNTWYFCKNAFIINIKRTFANVRLAELGLRGAIVVILYTTPFRCGAPAKARHVIYF